MAASEAAKAGGGGSLPIILGKRVGGPLRGVGVPAPVVEPKHESVPVKPVAASGNKVAKPEKEKGKGKAKSGDVSFSEGEVESMLTDDPNQWSVIIDAEAKRPDGPRPAVAALVLSVAELATDNPVPAPIMAELEKLAAVKG